MVKKILGTLLVVVVVLLGGALFLPQQVHVSRVVVVNRPVAAVFPWLTSLHRFNEWSPWAALDPNVKLDFSGPDAGVGATMTWSGNSKVGTGRQSIKEVVADQKVVCDLQFGGSGPAQAAWLLSPDETGTRIEWTLDMDVGNNPIGRYVGLFLDRMVGPDYERGLANLKQLVERAPEPQPAAQPTSPATTSANAATS